MESFEINKIKEQQKQHLLKQMAQQTGHSVAHLAVAQHTSHNPVMYDMFQDDDHDEWGTIPDDAGEDSVGEGPDLGPTLVEAGTQMGGTGVTIATQMGGTGVTTATQMGGPGVTTGMQATPMAMFVAVSYTHLTLPTICSV